MIGFCQDNCWHFVRFDRDPRTLGLRGGEEWHRDCEVRRCFWTRTGDLLFNDFVDDHKPMQHNPPHLARIWKSPCSRSSIPDCSSLPEAMPTLEPWRSASNPCRPSPPCLAKVVLYPPIRETRYLRRAWLGFSPVGQRRHLIRWGHATLD